MATTTETLTGAAERTGREPTIGASAQRGSSETLLSTVAYALSTLGGVAVAIVLVWMIVMLVKHLQTVALVLAGILAAGGAVELIRRNRSLSQ
jgi:hypothetical protein